MIEPSLESSQETSCLAIRLIFNDPGALSRCLGAIDTQEPGASAILVVDNAGSSSAKTVVYDLDMATPCDVLRLDSNTGPAGGHAAGLARFLESEAAFAWVMDDDCEPVPGSFATLLEAAVTTAEESDPTYPTWFNTSRGEITNYPAWCGFLIRRSTVEAVGLPQADDFWWMEDTEDLHWRIPEAGYSPNRVEGALVNHHQRRREGPKAAWKYYSSHGTRCILDSMCSVAEAAVFTAWPARWAGLSPVCQGNLIE